jgi:hypothetical protein
MSNEARTYRAIANISSLAEFNPALILYLRQITKISAG